MFKPKTVLALIDHVVDTLPSRDGTLFGPISLEYLRAMRALLRYQPHVEHLEKDEWISVVDFCIHGIQASHERSSEDLEFSQRGVSRSMSTPGLSNGRLKTRTGAKKDNAPREAASKHLNELIVCLQYLVGAGNAPLLARASAISKSSLEVLSTCSDKGEAQSAAFSVANTLLFATIKNRTSLAQETIEQLLPHIRRLWTAKSSSLKDQMLITLMLAEAPLHHVLKAERSSALLEDIDALLDTFQADDAAWREIHQLRLEHIGLSLRGFRSPLGSGTFYLRSKVPEHQQFWAILLTAARLMVFIDQLEATPMPTELSLSDRGDLACEPPSKRRRTSSRVDDLLRQITTSSKAKRLSALRLLCFVLTQRACLDNDLDSVLNLLMGVMLDEDPQVASWSMLAVAGYVLVENLDQA